MALPFLPGNSFDKNLGKSKFHKSQHFGYSNEVPLNLGEEKPGIGGERLPFQKDRPNHSSIPRGSGPALPTWVAFDKQVLNFDAFFQETVMEKRDEQFRVHRCKIYFYLEDDSIQIVEPREKNAGLPQGVIVRRHRVQRPPPNDEKFYTLEDFNNGNEIFIYGRIFKITDCDEFTKNFLKKIGIRLNPPIAIPSDPYSENRDQLKGTMQPLRPYERRDTLKQFLDHDRHVLRFYCYWDDRENMFGDPREMVLHYYLADNTIEVVEILPQNSGRDAVPMFLHRGQLPKTVEPLRKPGEVTDRTVLNVFGPMGHGGRYILDNLKMGAINQEFYRDNDLVIGAFINVWGRKFLICDCDEFTKEYYRTKYGIADFTPLRVRDDALKPTQKIEPRQPPPYNGFGSEEDSLSSAMSLLPKPPKKDFVKFMANDRLGLDGNVLRFFARLVTDRSTEECRRFIISYFLSDDTVQIFEPAIRNSGMTGGKFLERCKVKRPDQQPFGTSPSAYYAATDFFVGAEVDLNKHRFLLLDADEYAYNYMEKHSDQFRQSNIQLVMAKLGPLIAQARLDDFVSNSNLPLEQFFEIIRNISEGRVSIQEMITVARYYQDRKEDKEGLDALVGLVQEKLKQAGFEDFNHIVDQCLHFDFQRTGLLHSERLRTVFRSMKVPIPDDMLRALLSALAINDASMVNYNEVVQIINWRVNQVAPPTQLQNGGSDENWQGNQSRSQIQIVNVQALMQDINSNRP